MTLSEYTKELILELDKNISLISLIMYTYSIHFLAVCVP